MAAWAIAAAGAFGILLGLIGTTMLKIVGSRSGPITRSQLETNPYEVSLVLLARLLKPSAAVAVCAALVALPLLALG